MTKRSVPSRLAGLALTSDGAIGAVGCCLAVSALAFGVYMNVHGPAASLGTGHDFSVFAQFAPHRSRQAAPPSDGDTDLDTTATASIPVRGVPPDGTDTPDEKAAAAMVVEAADGDSATIDVEGRLRTVRVGDSLPGAGEVVAIVPGERPMLRTSRGFVISSRDR